jgi:RNA polymerase sigma-70 factor, ECF subfamily
MVQAMPTASLLSTDVATGSLPPGRLDRRNLHVCPADQLAVAARSGDDEAAGELYRRTRVRARRAASAFCPDADADDAVAEGLWRALRRIDQLRDPASVEAWMVRCVVRAAIDLSRRRRRLLASGEVVRLFEATESAAETAMSRLECDAMARAVGELAPGPRLLLHLRYEAGLSVQHIASTLGRPAGTVRRQCVEARRIAGQRFLRDHVRPAVGECAHVTEHLCREPYRPSSIRVRRRTGEHLRRCPACRDRQQELAAVLTELGWRPPRPLGATGSPE